MSHDTDKLIRQLSLVAFLMAERRPLTARDVKANVEGYQEMSDEAFARRFYSDRAELVGARRPARLAARRVHRRGALHARARSATSSAARAGRRRARSAADVPLPARGAVRLRRAAAPRAPEPGARPRRTRSTTPTATAVRVECATRTTRPSSQGRLGKLEGAISKQRTIRFRYWSIGRDERARAHGQPVRAAARERQSGTSSGATTTARRSRTSASRASAREIRFATRRERDFRVPADFDVEEYRGRADVAVRRRSPARRGSSVAPRHRLVGHARVSATPSRVDGGVSTTEYATLRLLASLDPAAGRPGHAARAARLRGDVVEAPARGATRRTRASRPRPAARAARAARTARARDRQAGPVAPERFGVLQSLLAYLLAACGDERERRDPARRADRALLDPARGARGAPLAPQPRQLRRRLLRGLRRAARRREVHVDKELFGDTFRRAPRLTPLEARAIRLALEFVGPMIAAGADSPLERVRAKLEETFGVFELAPERRRPQAGAEEDLVATLRRAIAEAAARRARVPEARVDRGRRRGSSSRTRSSGALPHWYVHTWDIDGDAPRSYRLDRMRNAQLRAIASRHATASIRALVEPTTACSGTRRRSRAGRSRGAHGARRRRGRLRRALADREWLVGEVLSFRGEAVMLAPASMRRAVGARARRSRRARGQPAAEADGSGKPERRPGPPGSDARSSVPPCASAIARAM